MKKLTLVLLLVLVVLASAADFTIYGVTIGTATSDNVKIKGFVKNNTGKDISGGLYIYIVLYDSSGENIGSEESIICASLRSGDKDDCTVFIKPDGYVARYEIKEIFQTHPDIKYTFTVED